MGGSRLVYFPRISSLDAASAVIHVRVQSPLTKKVCACAERVVLTWHACDIPILRGGKHHSLTRPSTEQLVSSFSRKNIHTQLWKCQVSWELLVYHHLVAFLKFSPKFAKVTSVLNITSNTWTSWRNWNKHVFITNHVSCYKSRLKCKIFHFTHTDGL